jgi:hypothetical protein
MRQLQDFRGNACSGFVLPSHRHVHWALNGAEGPAPWPEMEGLWPYDCHKDFSSDQKGNGVKIDRVSREESA